MLQLLAHDVRAADHTAQCRFVQDHPQAQRPGRVVDPVLTVQPHLQACAGLFGGEQGDHFPDDRAGVGRGLQHSRDHHRFVGAEADGVRLQGDVDALGDLAIGLPPARLPRFLGHLQQRLDDLRVRHPVDRAQIAHIAGTDAAAAVLQVTDLGPGDHQPLRHLAAPQPTGQAQPAQLDARTASPDSGVAVRRNERCTSGSTTSFGPQIAMEHRLLIACRASPRGSQNGL